MDSREYDRSFPEYQPKYRKYRHLMQNRVVDVLLVSSIYDSFIMEEDVRLSDQIYEEFQNLNLRALPQISRASSAGRALEVLQERHFDLVITMSRLGDLDPSNFADRVKEIQDVPVVLLLNNATELQYFRRENLDGTNIDKIFVWNGDSKVFIAIIKLIEDELNVDQDTEIGDVRIILVVEDSVRFYSLYLTVLYSEIMLHTHRLIHEGRNDYHALLQMTSRPKVLHATTYEEALTYYQKYNDHLLGVICDVKFARNGQLDDRAGYDLAKIIRDDGPTMPILLQSSDESRREGAERLRAYFANKNDPSLTHELQNFMLDNMGFGSFIFRLPNNEIVGSANNLFELREVLEEIPLESLVFHARNDHFSGWLSARGEFEMARSLKPRKVSEFDDMEDLRQLIIDSVDVILQEKLGIIIAFDRDSHHVHSRFIRLRSGSLGGKGRGLAFLLYLRSLFGSGFHNEFPDIFIQIPRTYVIGTDEFEQFLEQNALQDLISQDVSDEDIMQRFVNAELSDSLRSDLEFIFKDIQQPLAVRSSNTFEDSPFQPYAGVFATYMIANCHPDFSERINQLEMAIKLVYASTYLQLARSYAETIGLSIAESRMAIVIQEVVGRQYEDRYYPTFSGTAASYNYYPLGDRLQPEDRIAHVVLGLGKMVVEGGLARRFSPKHPAINIYASPDQIIQESQRDFFAIKRRCDATIDLERGEDTFIEKYDLKVSLEDGTLREIADTFRAQDRRFSSGFWSEKDGSPVLTFNRQLKYDTFPLAQIINRVLQLGEEAMGCPVEIEFAGDLPNEENEQATFYLLQMRPYIQHEDSMGKRVKIPDEALFLKTKEISGNRVIKDIQDIVYVKPDTFDNTQTLSIAEDVKRVNQQLLAEEQPYILIGPGRWGTHDRFLGVPVDWTGINGVGVIVEVDLPDFTVDHSQGSHFFHNIISAGIPYLCVPKNPLSGFIDWAWLDNLATVQETDFIKHVRAPSPMLVIVDGKEREGRIVKSESVLNWMD